MINFYRYWFESGWFLLFFVLFVFFLQSLDFVCKLVIYDYKKKSLKFWNPRNLGREMDGLIVKFGTPTSLRVVEVGGGNTSRYTSR